MFVLWRAPAEAKKKAEDEMVSRLSELPEDLRSKANQLRRTKHWTAVLAAKVKSVLADEKLDRERTALESNPNPARMHELASAQLEAATSDIFFHNEWQRLILSLPSQK
jgi:citrate synthase